MQNENGKPKKELVSARSGLKQAGFGFFGCRLNVLVVLRTRAVGVNDKKDPRFSNERKGEALSSGAG